MRLFFNDTRVGRIFSYIWKYFPKSRICSKDSDYKFKQATKYEEIANL